MGSAIKSATKIQVGKEAARGTAVAAARRIVTPQATYRRQETFEHFEEDMDGLLTRSSRAPLNTRNGTELEIGGFPLDFEQILLPLLSGVKGGITPTSPGTGKARLWTFKPSASADPAPDTFTVEFEESDFSSNAEMEAAYAFTNELEITGGDEGAPEVRFIMTARKTSDATKTAGLSLPALNPAANARWSVYVDDAWADLGNSRISGQVYGFTWKLGEFLRPGYYLDNRADLDFSKYEFGRRRVELSLDVVHDPSSSALVQTEEAHKSKGTTRFVRVEIAGPAFAAPDDGLNRFVRLDGAFRHMDGSMEERGGDREGLMSTQLVLQSTYDSVSTQDLQIAVQNDLATFP